MDIWENRQKKIKIILDFEGNINDQITYPKDAGLEFLNNLELCVLFIDIIMQFRIFDNNSINENINIKEKFTKSYTHTDKFKLTENDICLAKVKY